MKGIATLLAAAAVGLTGRAAAGAETWLEVKTPNFTIVSNAGEGTARKTAAEFEQVRAAYARIWKFVETTHIDPVVVLALKDENTLRRFAPQYFEVKGGIKVVSAWVHGSRRLYLLLRTDSRPDDVAVNPNYNLYRAYVRALISASFERRLPEWLSNGLAGVLGNTSIHDREVLVGRPIPWELKTFLNSGRYRLQQILDTRSDSPLLTKEDARATYDAQCYVLVHYLFFGERGANAPKLSQFQKLWFEGKTQDQAWAESLGDVEAVEGKLPNYVTQPLLSYARFPLETRIEGQTWPAVPMAPAELSGLQGAVLVAMGRPVEAQTAMREARTADPASAVSYDVEGLLADRDNDKARASQAYAQAAERGSKSANTYYRAAQLAWKSSPDAATLAVVRKHLEQAIALDPYYSYAYSFLADVLVDQGDGAAGLKNAQAAMTLEPAESYHRLVAARAYSKLGRNDEARQLAELARRSAENDVERSNADQFLLYLADRRRYEEGNPRQPAGNQAQDCQAGDAATCAKLLPDLEAACSGKQAAACAYLAVLHSEGQGLPKDGARALVFLEKACALGDKSSCVEQAFVVARGDGVKKDEARGLAALESLCHEPVAGACSRLALVYLGKSTPAARTKAKEALTRACSQGDPSACSAVAQVK